MTAIAGKGDAMIRPLTTKDIVRVTKGKMQGKTGVIVRETELDVCVVLTKVWDHGVWFGKEDVKRIGRVRRSYETTSLDRGAPL